MIYEEYIEQQFIKKYEEAQSAFRLNANPFASAILKAMGEAMTVDGELTKLAKKLGLGILHFLAMEDNYEEFRKEMKEHERAA